MHRKDIAAALGIKTQTLSVWCNDSGPKNNVVSLGKGTGRYMYAAPHIPSVGSAAAELAILQKKVDDLKATVKPVKVERSTKVFHTKAEIEQLAHEAYNHWAKNPLEVLSGETAMAVQRAVLPENRVRKVVNFGALKAVRVRLQEIILENINKPAAAPLVEIPPMVVDQVKETSTEINLDDVPYPVLCGVYHRRKAELEEAKQTQMDRSIDNLLAGQELSLDTQLRLEAVFINAGVKLHVPQPPKVAKVAPPVSKLAVPNKAHMPRVQIVGLMTGQEHDLRKAMGSMPVELFKTLGSDPVDTVNIPKSVDYVILNRKHTSHSLANVVKHQAKVIGATFIMIFGSGKAFQAMQLIVKHPHQRLGAEVFKHLDR